MKTIDEFVEMLAKETVAEDCENQYLIQEKKINLRTFLEEMKKNEPKVLLIGEAPGWKGCAETGIPFASYHEMNHCTIFPKGEFIISGDRWEKSANYMWSAFEKEGFMPLLWNAYPFHPFNNKLETNRKPRPEEIESGKKYITELIKIYNIKRVFAVGWTAYKLLKNMELSQFIDNKDESYIVHPAARQPKGQKPIKERIVDKIRLIKNTNF